MTRIEVRRGRVLRLRLVISDDAVVEAGHELGALLKRVVPAATAGVADLETSLRGESPIEVLTCPGPSELLRATPLKAHLLDDASYHAEMRQHLVDLFGSLCDVSLADAVEMVRAERARRAEGN